MNGMIAGIVISTMLVLTPLTNSTAAPHLYKHCPISRNGVEGLVLFDQTCSTGYVFPPPVAELRVVSALVSISDGECATIRAFESTMFGNLDQREDQKVELGRQRKEEKRRLQEATDLRTELTPIREVLSKRIDSYKSELSRAEEVFASTCSAEDEDSPRCRLLASRVGTARRSVEDEFERLVRLEAALEQAVESEQRLQANIQEISGKLANLENWFLISDDPARREAERQLEKFQERAGITVALALTSDIRQNMDRLRRQNRGKRINFVEMRWDSGSLHIAPLGTPVTSAPFGFTKLVVPGLVQDDGTLFINASGARLDLDAYSACKVFEYRRPSPTNLRRMMRLLSANVVGKAYLRYSALIDARIEVRFDYGRFYEFLAKAQSRNGLFRTSTIKEVVEELSGRNLISITVEDRRTIFSEDEKAALIEAMRNGLVQRAMDALDAEYVGVNPELSPRSPKFGAPVLAKELRKCANKWCQVGAAVVDIGHAIFGGSNQRESFVQSLQFLGGESYNEARAFSLTTDLTFEPRS